MIYASLLLISLFAAALESLSYFGFVTRHFFIPAYIWHLLAFVPPFFIFPKLPPWFKRLILVAAISSLGLYLALLALERINYQNYVYSKTHIYLYGLQAFVLLASFHTFILHQAPKSAFKWLGAGLLISSLIFTVSEGFSLTLVQIGKNVRLAIAEPTATYQKKVSRVYGDFYPAMQLVTELTPSNSLILIPPQGNPWEIEGNAAMDTYYLYPREVRNLTEMLPVTNKPIFALIAHGSWPKTGEVDYGWPKIALPSARVWRFDVKNGTVAEFKRPYDPTTDKWDWGLIEVRE